MKKYAFSLLAIGVLIASLSSCSDEESASIAGKWQGTESTSQAYITGFPTAFLEETDVDFNTEIEFKEDGTVIVDDTDDVFHAEGTWEYTDGKKKIAVSGAFPDDEIFDPTETFSVKELSGSKLTLILEKSGDFEYEGEQIDGTIKLTMKFERVGE